MRSSHPHGQQRSRSAAPPDKGRLEIIEMSHERHNIEITVVTQYVEQHSDPEKGDYRFAYTITIENRGTVGAQLLSRHWLIRDDNGKVQEVRGEGVVGKQPFLSPGDSFQYTSGSHLGTPHGTMEGSYEWEDEFKTRFRSPISPFYLSTPRVLH